MPSRASSGSDGHGPWYRAESSEDQEKWRSHRMGNFKPVRYKIIAVDAGSGEQFAPFSPGELEMSDPTREEFDAKLEATEARLETRLVSIDGKLDRLFDRVEESVRTSHRTEDASHRAENAAIDAWKAASNVKWNILFTALGTIGLIIAIWAVWTQGIEMIGTILSVPKP